MNIVKKFLAKIGTVRKHAALESVDVDCPGKKVKEVRKLGHEDVYCLSVPDTDCFIANGMVVHNCDALRYAIFSHFFNKELGRMSPEDLDRMYRDTIMGNDLPDVFQQPRY